MMNPEIKAQWISALRSGKYPQGRAALRSVGEDGRERYCCLGVPCELAVKAGIVSRRPEGGYAFSNFAVSESVLPGKVRDWAGLHSVNPDVALNVAGLVCRSGLAGCNDGGPVDVAEAFHDGSTVRVEPMDFDAIADLIKAQL